MSVLFYFFFYNLFVTRMLHFGLVSIDWILLSILTKKDNNRQSVSRQRHWIDSLALLLAPPQRLAEPRGISGQSRARSCTSLLNKYIHKYRNVSTHTNHFLSCVLFPLDCTRASPYWGLKTSELTILHFVLKPRYKGSLLQ